jgi:hypothetical protein
MYRNWFFDRCSTLALAYLCAIHPAVEQSPDCFGQRTGRQSSQRYSSQTLHFGMDWWELSELTGLLAIENDSNGYFAP